MSYALLRKVREWITPAAGTNDLAELIEQINAIRREWYAWYEKLNLFVDVSECFEVQRFCVDCNRCEDVYLGVTLPRHFANAEAMWFNNAPVRMHGRWRQWHEGMTPMCDCKLMKDDMGYDFPTERDLIPASPMKVRVVAFNAADVGKKIIIRGITPIGEKEFEMSLSLTPQETETPFIGLARPGGVVKEATVGRVAITDQTGRMLSMYDPSETIPGYTRIKISGISGRHDFVNILGARRYCEVVDDLDVCETDNQRAWEAMARYLRINRKTDRSVDDLRSEGAYLQQARELLLGDQSRQKGKATQSNLVVKTPVFNGRGLSRFRRRW